MVRLVPGVLSSRSDSRPDMGTLAPETVPKSSYREEHHVVHGDLPRVIAN
jgi:hypothetical protein